MEGVPLHPAVVHVPLGLAVLAPLLAVGLMVAIWRGWLHPRAWLIFVAIQLMLGCGGLAALQTGEKEEDLVGGMVPDEAVELHEERAELFLYAAGGVLVLSLVPLFLRRRGAAALGQLVVTAAAAGVLFLGLRAGHAGGLLVYRHGAAEAHLPGATGPSDAEDEDDAD